MNASKLLVPAVMLTAAASALATIAPPKPVAEATAPAKTVATVTPAVMGTRAPESYPVPERLQNYNDQKIERYAMRCQGIRCGSTSGSDNGWDDSDQ